MYTKKPSAIGVHQYGRFAKSFPGPGSSFASLTSSGTGGFISLPCHAPLDLPPAHFEHVRGLLAGYEAQTRPKIDDVAELIGEMLGVPPPVAQEFLDAVRYLSRFSRKPEAEIRQHFLIRAQRLLAERCGPSGIFVDGHRFSVHVSRTVGRIRPGVSRTSKREARAKIGTRVSIIPASPEAAASAGFAARSRR